ncbi:hypothetical protein ANN_06880 [Periplaneta americana]|uniref:DUF4817 domain-containing protein n=1 Tax=Periplaneta americana TaxID=6978 RepID=A0ABQ8TGG9_PERAM|nr:hypothetical protein ANN_06880 [Periplaneta americana]
MIDLIFYSKKVSEQNFEAPAATASSDTACANVVHFKIAAFTGAERAPCVFLFEETKSATVVQRRFRTQYGKDPPTRAPYFC